MNLLPCQVDGSTAVVDASRIGIDPAMAAQAQRQGGNLELGIRPEYLKLSTDPADGGIRVGINHIEDLGNYQIVTVQLGAHVIRVKLPEEQALRADAAYLHFPTEWTKIYADSRLVSANQRPMQP
ncbi:MAG: TOBE domain-containing protein, partial [Candidatus Tectomicrobia bacterium]|nr:TOBE domain-containing protein [Candidatus Tectomicrobia bacterium]